MSRADKKSGFAGKKLGCSKLRWFFDDVGPSQLGGPILNNRAEMISIGRRTINTRRFLGQITEVLIEIHARECRKPDENA